MDRGKKPSLSLLDRNSKIYMDLKDIIRENALRHLPAKSLHRCTGVCRDWKLYISTPFFAHNQSNSFHGISGFFCQSPSSSPSFISLDSKAYGIPDPSFGFLPEPVDIRCSSNGLICCQGRTGYNAYYICNPVSKRWKKLPKPDANHGSDPALVLVFEPSLLNFAADYKLVCAFPSDLDGYEFEIYSSTEESWRISGEIFFGNRKILPGSGVVAGDIIYWSTMNGGIVSFDLRSERSTVLQSYSFLGSLGKRNGKLICGSSCGSEITVSELSNAYTNTMQMNSKTKAWQVKQKIKLDNSVLSSTDDRRLLFLGDDVLVLRGREKLISYDMKTKETKQLAAEAGQESRLVPYVNSLVEMS